MRLMKDINTYGELCEEIERVKKSIEKVKKGKFYEFGDEFDLTIYLIHLEKTKTYNENRYKALQDFGVYECSECGSIHLEIETQENLEINGFDVAVKCNDCGHLEYKEITKIDLKNYIAPRGVFDWLWEKNSRGGYKDESKIYS